MNLLNVMKSAALAALIAVFTLAVPALAASTSTVSVSGPCNSVTIDQTNGAWSLVTTTNNTTSCSGGNVANVGQDGASVSSIFQLGKGLGASVGQTGDGNLSVIDQQTRHAAAIVTQIGSGNATGVTQTGEGAYAYVISTGDNNSASVSQAVRLDWSSVSITGNGNGVTVNQH